MAWHTPVSYAHGDPVDENTFNAIASDLRVRGAVVDGGGYGRANTGFLTLNPGAMPGTPYTVSAASWAGSVATVTIGAHAVLVNQVVTVSAISPSGYNATAIVTAITGTAIKYALVVNPGAYVSGGGVVVGAAPTNGTLAVDGSYIFRIWNGSSWVAATTAAFAGVWWSGAGAPGGGTGSNGDMYLNVTNGDVYGPKAGGAWGQSSGNIKGPTGSTGATGATGGTGPTGYSPVWIVGAGAPAGGTGNVGDSYLNSTTADVYGPKTGGGWGSIVANIKGLTGATGTGAVWLSGAGVPAGGTGNNGDMYLNTSTGDVYGPKAGGAWGAIVKNLVGPAGGMSDPGGNGILKRTALNTTAVATAADLEGALTFTNITTGNVSTTAHGHCPILPNDATKFLNGVGTWAVLVPSQWTTNASDINFAGKVAIGSASNTYQLEVSKNMDFSTSYGQLKLGTTTGTKGMYLGYSQTGDYAAIQATEPGVSVRHLVLQPIGGFTSFGMGTTMPTYLVQLGLDSAAKPTTNTWTVPSDQRLKSAVTRFTDGLETIRRLRPVNYTYNGDGGTPAGAKGVGFLAHEARQCLPDAVGTRRGKLKPDDAQETDILDFNSHALTFVLVNAVQELDRKLNARSAPELSSAPVSDASIPYGGMAMWHDEIGGRLVVRVRTGSGILKTGSIPLI